MRFHGKTALVTGGSSGIELARARLLAAEEMKMAQAEHFDALVLGSGSGGMGMTPVRIVA